MDETHCWCVLHVLDDVICVVLFTAVRRGLRTHPCGTPILTVILSDLLFPESLVLQGSVRSQWSQFMNQVLWDYGVES